MAVLLRIICGEWGIGKASFLQFTLPSDLQNSNYNYSTELLDYVEQKYSYTVSLHGKDLVISTARYTEKERKDILQIAKLYWIASCLEEGKPFEVPVDKQKLKPEFTPKPRPSSSSGSKSKYGYFFDLEDIYSEKKYFNNKKNKYNNIIDKIYNFNYKY
ncbi:hypothetical protein KY312_01835 [Candidatus Woesearchaeota archaeon]|nr:hypothetical protein [Candidatus Woesearchaeota archaeon]